jgi:succinate-acetate transporter protein
MQMMVMSLFAVFWLSFGLLQVPTLGLAAAYSATGDAAEGAASKEYNAVIGLYLIVWGFALFTFWIFTLKTNAVFAGIFGFVTLAACCCEVAEGTSPSELRLPAAESFLSCLQWALTACLMCDVH